jgi:hypothetical protein
MYLDVDCFRPKKNKLLSHFIFLLRVRQASEGVFLCFFQIGLFSEEKRLLHFGEWGGAGVRDNLCQHLVHCITIVVGVAYFQSYVFSCASSLYPKKIKSICEVFLKFSSGNQIQNGHLIRISSWSQHYGQHILVRRNLILVAYRTLF